MLRTLSTVGASEEKRHQSSNNFNKNLPENCTDDEVLQGFCAVLKTPGDAEITQRCSSSDSGEGLKIHFNTSEENETELKNADKIFLKDYENTAKESESKF